MCGPFPGRYCLAVQAVNGAGATTTVESDGAVVDNSPPVVPSTQVADGLDVLADVVQQRSATVLSASWQAFSDLETGVAGYEIGFGVGGGSSLDSVSPFTSVGTATTATVSGLALAHGVTYVAAVRATNGAGMTSTATSNGVLINTAVPDSTSVLTCASVLTPTTSVRVSSTTTRCTIQARSAGVAVKAFAHEFALELAAAAGTHASPSDGSALGALPATVTPLTADGYTMVFNYSAPATTAAVQLRVRVGGANIQNSPVQLNVVGYADATSTITCTPTAASLVGSATGYVRRGAVIGCEVFPRTAGVRTRIVAADMRMTTLQGYLTFAGITGATGDPNDPVALAWIPKANGRSFVTNYVAPPSGHLDNITAVFRQAGGQFQTTAAHTSLFLVANPSIASSLQCASSLVPTTSLRLYSTASCTVTVADAMGVVRALASDFRQSSPSSSASFTPLVTADNCFTFTFKVNASNPTATTARVTVALASSNLPITTGAAVFNVAVHPDHTSQLSCADSAEVSAAVISAGGGTQAQSATIANTETVVCTLKVFRESVVGHAVPSDFTVGSSIGVTGALAPSAFNVNDLVFT